MAKTPDHTYWSGASRLRWVWDLNPRSHRCDDGFQDRSLRPLGQPTPRRHRAPGGWGAARCVEQPSRSAVALALAQGEFGRLRPAVALVGQRDLVARLVGPDLTDQRRAALDRSVVELGDHVAGLQPRLGRGTVRGDGRGAARALVRDGRAAGLLLHRHRRADHRVDGLARLDQLLGDVLGLVDRDGEAEADRTGLGLADAAAAGGLDGGVDADDRTTRVQERPARVARVDRGVGLQGAHVRVLVAGAVTGGHRAVLRADDAGGDRVG